MKDIKKVEEIFNSNFQGQEVSIELQGNIKYWFKLINFKFMINKLNLIISDDNEQQMVIGLDEVDAINVADDIIELKFDFDENIKIYV